LRDHVSRRLRFQLDRFGRAIELVRVRMPKPARAHAA
jgi:hypothetical protein